MGNIPLAEVDKIRAAILAEVIRRDYLEQMLEKAKLMECSYGKDYPRNLCKALEDLMETELNRAE